MTRARKTDPKTTTTLPIDPDVQAQIGSGGGQSTTAEGDENVSKRFARTVADELRRPQGPAPLGMPRNVLSAPRPYRARSLDTFVSQARSGMQGMDQRFPLYTAEDVFAPGQQWSRQQRLDWQLQMVAAGRLSETNFAPGDWDAPTQAAYRNLLEIANQQGLTKEEALAEMAANPTLAAMRRAMEGASGSGRQITLANPQDLAAVANEVAPREIGRRFNDAEMAQFVDSFHAAQRGGGNPPQLDVAAEAAAREKAPTEAAARDLKDVFDVVLNMMRGGGQSAG